MSANEPKAATAAPKKQKRLILNATDKQYVVEGLKRVREDAKKAEKSMFFDPEKVVSRIDEIIESYSK